MKNTDMRNTDPYRLAEAAPDTGSPAPGRTAVSRRHVLWVVLVLSAAGNTVTSYGTTSPWVQASFGIVTLACIAALLIGRSRRGWR